MEHPLNDQQAVPSLADSFTRYSSVLLQSSPTLLLKPSEEALKELPDLGSDLESDFGLDVRDQLDLLMEIIDSDSELISESDTIVFDSNISDNDMLTVCESDTHCENLECIKCHSNTDHLFNIIDQ